MPSVALDRYLCHFVPDEAMVEAAQAGKSDDLRAERGSSLERPPVRRISEPRVNSLGVVVGDGLTKSPMQMPLVEYDDAVEELSAASAASSFQDRVSVVHEIGGCGCLGNASRSCCADPLRRGVRGDAEVHHV